MLNSKKLDDEAEAPRSVWLGVNAALDVPIIVPVEKVKILLLTKMSGVPVTVEAVL